MLEYRLKARQFQYLGFDLAAATQTLTCTYALDELQFTERIVFPWWSGPTTEQGLAAARLVFLLAGVSYYKAAAPELIDLGEHSISSAELDLLKAFYTEGLREFEATQPSHDLVDLAKVEFKAQIQPTVAVQISQDLGLRPLIPFGGGIDSTVVVEEFADVAAGQALFVASYSGQLNAVIEAVAPLTGLPILRAQRWLDPKILAPKTHNFRTGHIPVTGLLSALAVLTAVLGDRTSVVMSNEWSSSSPTILPDGREVNHQWSKSFEFESLFRAVVQESLAGFDYYSALRPRSELWVAQRFAKLTQYHAVFRSCNRAFHVDPAKRAENWCGECDKCCFINLILAPYLSPTALGEIFRGKEPLANPGLAPKFRSLLGDPAEVKPFECVGDAGECRTAVQLAAARPDRAQFPLLAELTGFIQAQGWEVRPAEHWLQPLGAHFVPEFLT